MARVRVRMRSAGARAVLTSPGVAADLLRRAEAIRDAANAAAGEKPDGIEEDSYDAADISGGTRARAVVGTWSPFGVYDNAANDTLVRSIDAGRR